MEARIREEREKRETENRIFPRVSAEERGFTIPRIVRRGVLPTQVSTRHLEGTCGCVFDGSIRPRRTVRSDCRFARSTTYTRPTDVFLPQRQTGDCSSSGFWTIGPLASSKFFPRISEGFVFRSKLLETFASRFERNLTQGFV